MAYTAHDDPVTTSRELIRLLIDSIDKSNKAKNLRLTNSRAELRLQLSRAFVELGNRRSLPQNNEPLSTLARSFLKIFQAFFVKDNDSGLKTEAPYGKPQPVLARNSCKQAESPGQYPIRLPETVEQLRAVAQQISGLLKPNSSRPDVLLDRGVDHDRTSNASQTTIRERYDVNNVHESREESGRQDFKASEAGLSFTVKLQANKTREDGWGKLFMLHAYEFYKKTIEPIENKRPIKVAVLDTGVNGEHTHFIGVRGPKGTSIKRAISFVGGETTDDEGHGTDVAALVVDIAPHVDLYIAKINKMREGPDEGQLVKAINWAMEHEVDIINISASFEDNVENREAINKAEAQGIIILAAASNKGANAPRAFPARMDNVIAIHATDGMGNPCGFNPNPWPKVFNLSTLGTDIPSPLEDDKFVPKGTSYSTPIAAGMAANILTLVESFHGPDNDDLTQYRAHRREGMQAMFESFAGLRGSYDYICFNALGQKLKKSSSWPRSLLQPA